MGVGVINYNKKRNQNKPNIQSYNHIIKPPETREEKQFSAVREVITSHMQHGREIGTELICEYNELVRQLYKKQKQPGIEFVDDLKG